MDATRRHMPRRGTLVLACMACLAQAPVPGARADEAVPAPDPGADRAGISITGEVDAVSRYVWRTLAYSEGAVVQPSATLGFRSLELNAWANVDPSFAGTGSLTEVDLSVLWTLDLGVIEAIPSVMLYTYPHVAGANTGEVQLELRRDIPGNLGAFVRHSTDVLDYPGASFTFAGLDREWSFEDGGSLSLAAQVGRGSRRFSDAYLPGTPALRVAGLSASWTLPMGRGWAARPHLEWLEVVDAEARALLPVRAPVTFGIALGRL